MGQEGQEAPADTMIGTVVGVGGDVYAAEVSADEAVVRAAGPLRRHIEKGIPREYFYSQHYLREFLNSPPPHAIVRLEDIHADPGSFREGHTVVSHASDEREGML